MGGMELTSFRPIVASAALTENKVIRSEKTSKGAGSDGIHSSGLEIDKNGAGNIFVGSNLVIINGDALELEVVCALVKAVALDAMLVRDDFPEFSACSEKLVVNGIIMTSIADG
jgi:hypothetical protein